MASNERNKLSEIISQLQLLATWKSLSATTCIFLTYIFLQLCHKELKSKVKSEISNWLSDGSSRQSNQFAELHQVNFCSDVRADNRPVLYQPIVLLLFYECYSWYCNAQFYILSCFKQTYLWQAQSLACKWSFNIWRPTLLLFPSSRVWNLVCEVLKKKSFTHFITGLNHCSVVLLVKSFTHLRQLFEAL